MATKYRVLVGLNFPSDERVTRRILAGEDVPAAERKERRLEPGDVVDGTVVPARTLAAALANGWMEEVD